MTVPIAMIAAIGENRVIGVDGVIPWRLPSDFAYFKRTTLGKPILMGRKTFESIGRPLPGRTNIVVSRQAGYQPDGVLVISDLDAALDHARSIAAADEASEVMVIGGGTIYKQAMPYAERLYITHVALSPDGDAVFPPIDPNDWSEVERLEIRRSEKDNADFCVKIYHRRQDRRR